MTPVLEVALAFLGPRIHAVNFMMWTMQDRIMFDKVTQAICLG